MTDNLPKIVTHDVTGLPKLIERYTDVPALTRHVYELTPNGYELTTGGRQLRNLRQALRDYVSLDSVPPQVWGKKPTEIGLRDWSTTIGVATTSERKDLLKLAASGKVKISR